MKQLFIVTTILLLYGCSENKVSLNELSHEKFSIELRKSLDMIGEDLKLNHINFTNTQIVNKRAKELLKTSYNDEVAYSFEQSYLKNIYVKSLNQNARVSNNSGSNLSEFETNLIHDTYELLRSSENPTAYQEDIQNLLNEILSSETNGQNKNIALVYLTGQVVGVDFAKENISLFYSETRSDNFGRVTQDPSQLGECYQHETIPPECESDWWSDWGKCVAGTIGGTGTGLLAGGAAGSVIPFVGTTAGAIIGAISGGLTGAATFCGGGTGGGGIYEKNCLEEDANGNCPGDYMYFKE